MRKFVIALLVGVAITMAACGSPSLTSVQAKAVKDVEAQLVQYGVTSTTAPVVEAVIKDTHGNTDTLVYVVGSASNGTKVNLLIIIVTTPKGSLYFADVLVPTGTVTVQ